LPAVPFWPNAIADAPHHFIAEIPLNEEAFLAKVQRSSPR
jgi:hypothetical protein